MRKSTCKESLELIRNYILESVENELDTEMTEIGKIKYLKDRFYTEKSYQLTRNEMLLNVMNDWYRGLAISVDYCYSDTNKLVFEWLDYTEEEQEQANQQKTDDKYWHLLTMVTRKMFDDIKGAE